MFGQRVKSEKMSSSFVVAESKPTVTPRRQQKDAKCTHVCVLKLELSYKCDFQKHEWETSRLKFFVSLRLDSPPSTTRGGKPKCLAKGSNQKR